MRRLVVVLALALLPLTGARAQFCPGASPFVFADVLASDPFCGYVTWMAQNNVTLGCQVIDANNRLYCPADGVTRLQMAGFMSRLSDALFPSSCAAGEVMKWNGAVWTCAADNIGGGGGGGTVTSVLAGTGLSASPNPITGAGSINLALGYQLPQGCANGQVAKSNGTGGWTCAADNAGNAGGTVTSLTQGSGIVLAPNPIVAAGTVSADTAYLQRRVGASCAAGSSIRAIAADGAVTCETDDTGPANAFVPGGNAFGGAVALGTSDNYALDIRANGARVMRYSPNAISPNVIGGNLNNSFGAGVRGATIAGGGVAGGDSDPDFDSEAPNRVTDHYGFVGGGYGNQAGDPAGTTSNHAFATVGGGFNNTAGGFTSTVGGGAWNRASASDSTVGGGQSNIASGADSTVAGGQANSASGETSVIGGGFASTASGDYSTIGGGHGNTASGQYSTVPGGDDNVARGNFSLAMGQRAKANHNGAFVWADSSPFDFASAGVNNFRVRATGGVRFVVDIDAGGAFTWSCVLNAGAGWGCASDRNLKHSLVELDARAVLDKVAGLPVYQWQPKGQNAHVLHYGPMAQDFHAAFGLGDDDTMIGMQDADGVALAAIKGLNEKVETKIAAQSREIAELREQVVDARAIRAELVALKEALAELRRGRSALAAR